LKQIYNNEDCLVLTSGGQDSTTCLFWAQKNFRKVSAMSFVYGQKHSEEVEVSRNICRDLGIDLKVLDISFMTELVKSNLFEGQGDVNKSHELSDEVPSSFVPYRNMIFLTLASAWASTIGVKHIITGVCETDSSGYADCRDVFVKSLQVSLNLATDFKDRNAVIHTPLMWLTKGETFKMAEELGCLNYIIEKTLTCYNGDKTMNEYGMGCSECPSCKLRKAGYNDYKGKYLK
jgi:7-cyano-7-deazaguanine synthase